MAKANYKSALHHVKQAQKGVEAAELHLLQAKAAIPKSDEENRNWTVEAIKRLKGFDMACNEVAADLEKIMTEAESPEE